MKVLYEVESLDELAKFFEERGAVASANAKQAGSVKETAKLDVEANTYRQVAMIVRNTVIKDKK